jgi:type VI secretion system protein ImpE
MQLEELVRSGQLQKACSALEEQIRKDPANPKLRVFYFQLLSVLGDWDRAMNQLHIAGEMNTENGFMFSMYRPALQSEVLRSEIFSGKKTPLVFSEPKDWMAWLIQANQLAGQEQWQAAAELRDKTFESADSVTGRIDDEPFEWIADADPRLGPMLEAVIDGKYYWIPFSVIRCLVIDKPGDLRDMVWTVAQFEWINGGQSVGLIPSRYPASYGSMESEISMARKTEWIEKPHGYYLGLGQRMLVTDRQEYPLLNIRRIELNPFQPENEGDIK